MHCPRRRRHSAGARKEHRLHVDLRPGEKLFFHTSCGWMMWNWQLSALASGVEIVLFDGAVTSPRTLWDIVCDERVNVFGTSPAYLKLCQNLSFRSDRELPALRAILSTGSILYDEQFDWVEANVKHVRKVDFRRQRHYRVLRVGKSQPPGVARRGAVPEPGLDVRA